MEQAEQISSRLQISYGYMGEPLMPITSSVLETSWEVVCLFVCGMRRAALVAITGANKLTAYDYR